MANPENVIGNEKGKFKRGDDAPRRAAEKSNKIQKKKADLRALVATTLTTKVEELSKSQMKDLARAGMDEEKPDVQALIVARLLGIALNGKPLSALQAIQMVAEMTGADARSAIAAAQREIDKEKLALEREKVEAGKQVAEAIVVQLGDAEEYAG